MALIPAAVTTLASVWSQPHLTLVDAKISQCNYPDYSNSQLPAKEQEDLQHNLTFSWHHAEALLPWPRRYDSRDTEKYSLHAFR